LDIFFTSLLLEKLELLRRCRSLLLKELKRALLGNIARLLQLLQRLLASRVLLLADDAALASLHEIALCQAAGRVLGRAMPDLGLRSYRRHLSTHHILHGAVIVRHSIFMV